MGFPRQEYWSGLPFPSPNKGLLSNIYKQLIQFNIKNTNNPVKKWAGKLNRYFFKEERQMANRYRKRFSILLIIRKLLIKIHNKISAHTCQNGYHQREYK